MVNVFPEAAVEAIIREELQSGRETKKWTTPKARLRYSLLLAEQVVRRSERDDVLQQLRRTFEARYELSPYANDRPQIFSFPPSAHDNLSRVFNAVEDALVSVVSRQAVWPAETLLAHDIGQRFLMECLTDIVDARASATATFDAGGMVGFTSEHAVLFDNALSACQCLLMTSDEATTFNEWFNRAQGLIRSYRMMFNLPDDAPVS